MTATVHPLHPCRQCGEQGELIELYLGDDYQTTIQSCRACVERAQGELARVRPVFDAMIACGVPRDIANDTMIFLLDRFSP